MRSATAVKVALNLAPCTYVCVRWGVGLVRIRMCIYGCLYVSPHPPLSLSLSPPLCVSLYLYLYLSLSLFLSLSLSLCVCVCLCVYRC
jgi:hypothetical protein